MGLSLEFYAGDAAVIGEDFSAIEFDGIRDGTRARAYADLSLHVTADDLDLLSEVIAERVGAAKLPLSASLVRSVGGFDGEGSAEVVDPSWVGMVAKVDLATAADLTAEWGKRVGRECGQQLPVTPAAVTAVAQLIQLCRLAIQEGVEVVHTWYL